MIPVKNTLFTDNKRIIFEVDCFCLFLEKFNSTKKIKITLYKKLEADRENNSIQC